MWFRTRAEESAPTRDARVGAERAEAELAEVKKRRAVVDHLAEVIAVAIDRNHFGEQIERSLSLRRRSL
ncbi:hypothetical protein [Nocardia sp. No.11]|uniref:DUF7620 family protein n=1 Tax=Nocardia sp. No.11 TaxID=3128861 RepID=UPI00319DE685